MSIYFPHIVLYSKPQQLFAITSALFNFIRSIVVVFVLFLFFNLDKIVLTVQLLKKGIQWTRTIFQGINNNVQTKRDEERKRIDCFLFGENSDTGQYLDYVKNTLLHQTMQDDNSMFYDIDNNAIFDYLRVYPLDAIKPYNETWGIRKDVSQPEVLMHIEQRKLEAFSEDSQKYMVTEAKMPERFALIGSPGSGKTLYLKLFAYKILEANVHVTSGEERTLPIYITPHKWLGKEKTLEDLAVLELHEVLCNYHQNISEEAVRRYVQSKFQTQKIRLLIDDFDKLLPGINEKKWSHLYDGLVRNIKNDKTPIIIATRIVDNQPKLVDLYVLNTLLPLDVPHILKHIRANSWILPEEDLKVIQHSFASSTRLQTMIVSPLNLLKFCSLYRSSQLKQSATDELPSQIKLCEYTIDIAFRKKIERHKSTWNFLSKWHSYQEKEKINKIEHLAWMMHKKGLIICDQKTEKEFLGSQSEMFLSKDELKNYINHSGLIVEGLSADSNQYSFINLPVQEYMVARYLLRHRSEANTILKEKYNEPWWENVILLYLLLYSETSKGNKPDKIKSITDAIRGWLPSPNAPTSFKALSGILMAGRVLKISRFQENDAILFFKQVCVHLFQFLEDENSVFIKEIIAAVIAVLKPFANKTILEDLSKTAADAGLSRAKQILDTWTGQMQDTNKYYPIYLPSLDQYANTDYVYPNLNNIHDDKIENLINEPAMHREVFLILSVLSISNGLNITNKLTDLLGNKTLDKNLRAAIARTLGKIGNARNAQALISYLHDDDDALVKWYIIDALGVLGERLGYWSDHHPLSIKQSLIDSIHPIKEAIASATDDQIKVSLLCILIKIEMTLATKVEHLGDRNLQTYATYTNYGIDDSWFLKNSIEAGLRKIMRAFYAGWGQSYEEIVIETLQSMELLHLSPEQWIYVTNILEQFAKNGDDNLLQNLEKFSLNSGTCPMINAAAQGSGTPPHCQSSKPCTNRHCSNQPVKEHIELAKWVAEKRKVTV